MAHYDGHHHNSHQPRRLLLSELAQIPHIQAEFQGIRDSKREATAAISKEIDLIVRGTRKVLEQRYLHSGSSTSIGSTPSSRSSTNSSRLKSNSSPSLASGGYEILPEEGKEVIENYEFIAHIIDR